MILNRHMLMLFFINFILISSSWGQPVHYCGKIVDSETGEGLSFAAMYVPGTDLSMISDEKGEFEFESGADSLWLEIRHTAYKPISLCIKPGNFYLIELTANLTDLGEVLVSGSYSRIRLNKAAGSMNVILPDESSTLNHLTIKSLTDKSPGVFMANGTHSTSRLIIRGMGARNQYGTNRIRMYIDGIPFSGIDGSASPEIINPENIRKMEIIKGPSSALYGAGLGGTLLMQSYSRKKDGPEASVNASMGRWGYRKLSARAGYKKEGKSLFVSGRRIGTEGFRENSKYKGEDLYFRTSYDRGKWGVSALLRYNSLNAQIPSSLNLTDYTNSPSAAAESWLGVKGFKEMSALTAGISADYSINSRINISTTIFGGFEDSYESRPFNIFSQALNSAGIRQKFMYRWERAELHFGYEGIREKTGWSVFDTEEGRKGEKTNSAGDHRNYLSVFLHTENEWISGLRVESGVSLSYVGYEISDRFADNKDFSGSYSYSPVLSPRLGLNYEVNRNIYSYFSVGHGFSPPGLEETLLPEGEVNNGIRPEKGWTWETGVRGSNAMESFYFDLGVYYIGLSDLLVTRRLAEDRFVNVNAGRSRHYGAELFLKYSVLPALRPESQKLYLSFSSGISKNSFVEFRDDQHDYSGRELPGIPGITLNPSLKYTFPGYFSTGMYFRYSGKQFLNDTNEGLYKGHSLVDAELISGKLNIGRNISLTLFVKVFNLLNKKHASMILFNAASFGGQEPRYYYPGEPVHIRGGVKLNSK